MKQVSGYFSDPKSLEPALIHRSYCNEHPGLTSNERLEFLGDSILSLVISERLYKLFPNIPEGELTARRSAIVQTKSLANKALDLGLDELLKLSRGEQELGGRKNPSLLANTFEAVLGALYLDSGIDMARKYLLDVFADLELIELNDLKDPKSLLQELSQSTNNGTPNYQTVNANGPDHAKTFTVAVVIKGKQIATGVGGSKQKAETEAAKAALINMFPEAKM